MIRASLGRIVAEFANREHLHKKTLYRCIFRYFYYGCVPNAFLPRFDLRGGAGQSRIAGVSKLGRPRNIVASGHDESSLGVNVSDEDKENFLWSIKKYWASGDRAELLGKSARGLVTGLGITLDIASGYRPDWKGLVEQKFNTLNNTVIHFVPGAVRHLADQRLRAA